MDWPRRWGRVLLVLSTLATQGLFAYQPEKSFWDERRRETKKMRRGDAAGPVLLANVPASSGIPLSPLPSISSSLQQDASANLPKQFAEQHAAILQGLATYGHVQKVTLPSDPKASRLVVLIQDVHRNTEAQRDIGQAVKTLVDRKTVGLVALEGAFIPLRLERFRSFPDHGTILKVADFLLRENKISGPAHTALTYAGEFPPVVGIDDAAHYRANIKAYKDSAPEIALFRQNISEQQTDLDHLKENVFNQKLREFDRTIETYRRGGISFGEYVKWLATTAQGNTAHSAVNNFIKAFDMERTMDFQRVETERNRLVERLADSLTQEQTALFIKQSTAYRLGQLRYADFYRALGDLCRTNGVPLSHFPAMETYVRYVLAVDQISGEALFDALAQMESAGYTRFARTPEEKRLIQKSRRLSLTAKLLDFSLTTDEWKEYAALEPGSLPLASFEAFYKEAMARDTAMAKNLITAMGTNRISTAILVAGGFHSRGLEEHLRQAGIAVLSFVPKIEKVDTDQGGAAYLTIFSQEKTPLEKLFQGEKLFLSIPPIAPEVENGLLPILVVARQFFLKEARHLRDQLVGTTETLFKNLSADPRSAKAVVESIKVSDTQVAVSVTVAGETATTVVTFNGAEADISESHVLSPEHLTNLDAVKWAAQINQNTASLAPTLWRVWDEKMSAGNVFRYTLTDVERTIFPSSIKQFNPKRGGKRPRQMDTAQLNQPFDPNAFHFDSPKMNPQEILAEGCLLGDVEVDYVANVNPFGQGHVLITPERKKHHNQFFIPQAAKAAFRTLRTIGGRLKIGFNSVGAFASINHLHLQALPYHSEMFPVEAAFEQEGSKELLIERGGVRLWHLTGWPIKPFVIEGPDENSMVTDLMKIVDVLHNANQPYNLLFTLSPEGHFRVFIFPRQPERSSPFGTGLAFFEVAGEFLFVQPEGVSYEEAKALYQKTTEPALLNALAEIRVADPVLAQLKEGFTSAIGAPNPPLPASPPTNSLLYLLTRDWKMGWFGALLDMGILLGGVNNLSFSLISVMLVLFSIHSLVAVKRGRGESLSHYLARLAPRFVLHMLAAAPYAFIGTPHFGDPMTVMAVTWHLVYDGILMKWDQIRLAQRDLRALGIAVPENRVPPSLLNFLIPLEKSSVNDLDGRHDRLRQAGERIKHGGPYAREWAHTVDTVAHLSVVAPDDLPVLRAMVQTIQKTNDQAPVELLLVPGNDDPSFRAELQRLTAGVHRVTLLTPTFEKGILRISNRSFVHWANGKGSILWVVTKNPAVTHVIQADDEDPHPALRQVMDLLRFAPPLRPIDFTDAINLAIAVLKFA